MRAVLVLPAAPVPFGDTAARWFHLLARDLLARGHQVSCLTVTDESAATLREAQDRLAAAAPAGRLRFQAFPLRAPINPVCRKLRSAWRPFSELLYAPGFRAALRTELARGYDVLHLEQLWSGWAGLGMARTLLNIHHLEIIDLEDARGGTLYERKARWQMARATSRLLRATPSMRLFSSRLLDRVRTFNDSARCFVVPFALDLGLYPMQPPVDAPVVGLLGSMHWPPSRSAAERLVTRICRSCARARRTRGSSWPDGTRAATSPAMRPSRASRSRKTSRARPTSSRACPCSRTRPVAVAG